MSQPYDMIIIGGGLVGLLTATLLQSRYRIAIVDPQLDIAAQRPITDFHSNSGGDGDTLSAQPTQRVTAINPSSQALISSVANWATAEQAAYPYFGMHVIDAASNQPLRFDGQQIGQLPMGWMAHNHQLLNTLCEAVDRQRVTILNHAFAPQENTAEQLMQGKIVIDQTPYQADLIIAADGAQSPVRQLLDQPYYRHDYGQHGVVATIRHDHDNEHIARQWFIGNDILAFLPIAPHHCSIVWSTDAPARLQQASEADFCQWLTDYSHGAVGRISAATTRLSFPLQYGRAKHMVNGQLALIGDAAHRVHPMAGLGANLGFEDAGALASTISKRISSSALARFSRERELANWKTQQAIDSLFRIYQWQHPLLTTARGLGMKAIHELSPLKNIFAKQAAGNA